MSDTHDTVELPAHPEIKQLSHDIVREENEYTIPILLDLYSLLSDLDENEPIPAGEISVDNPQSELGVSEWSEFLKLLQRVEIIERGNDSRASYVLSEN